MEPHPVSNQHIDPDDLIREGYAREAALLARCDAAEAERDRLRERHDRLWDALHRIHRGDPMPHKIAAEALTFWPDEPVAP
jgi:hypothetical protein